jgi:hypothetical protein
MHSGYYFHSTRISKGDYVLRASSHSQSSHALDIPLCCGTQRLLKSYDT